MSNEMKKLCNLFVTFLKYRDTNEIEKTERVCEDMDKCWRLLSREEQVCFNQLSIDEITIRSMEERMING